MVKDRKYLEELFDSEDFYELLGHVFVAFNFHVNGFVYNEADDCFYAYAWQTWNDQKYRIRMAIKNLENGGPDDLDCDFWLGNFKNPEQMTDWKDEFCFGGAIYKDGKWLE